MRNERTAQDKMWDTEPMNINQKQSTIQTAQLTKYTGGR